LSDNDRLSALNERIAKLKATQEDNTPHVDDHYSQAHLGWRMVIELVAGLLIGFGMGYGLDSLFGTLPIFLVLFTMLGLAAGIKTMMRTAQEFQRTSESGGKTNGGNTASVTEGPGNGGKH
jgi:ATP synthase protein I